MKFKLRSTAGIWFLSILTFAGVAGLMLFSTFYMNRAILAEEDAQAKRMEYRQLGEDLADASDYLTKEVRYYAITGEIEHLTNYWEEIFETRERERVISAFENENPPENEKLLLEQAKRFSDLLVETETCAMKLVLMSEEKTAQDYSYDSKTMEYVSYVLSYEISDETEGIISAGMTSEEMREKAVSILYDDNYELYKNKIMTPIEEFIGTMNDRMNQEVEKRKEETWIATIIQLLLAAVELIAIAFLLYLMKQMGGAVAAKKEAELENEAKSTFLAQMTHELRTPLNAVNGYTFLLEQTRIDEKQKEYLRGIHNSAEGLLKLINQILDFSKIEAGHLVIENTAFFLKELLSEVESIFREQAERKGLFLRFEIDDAVPDAIMGDPLRLRQVLINLMGNAFKFTEEGGVTVTVRLLERKTERCLLRFSVADTGIGIEAEAQEKVFHPFTQKDASVTRKYGGTGLGLSISKEIIAMSGYGSHQLEMDSEPGKGSVFWFDMDFSFPKGKSSSASFGTERESRARQQIPQYYGKKVLLTDDSEINIRIQSEILSLCHLTVLTAESGTEALEILKKHSDIDLIFMDIRMPHMDGYETARRIRSIEGYQDTPVIALTADAVPQVQDRIKEAGMNGMLLKPISQQQLFVLLGRYLSEDNAKNTAEDGPLPNMFAQDTCLKQLDGNQTALQQIINRFLELHQGDDKRLEEYIEKEDYRKAEELIHQLKGISGNLGCIELYKCCKSFQKELRKRNPDRIEEFKALWEKTLKELKEFRNEKAQEQEARDKTSRPPADQEVLVAKIHELSSNYDIEAIYILEEHMEELKEVMTEENYKKIKQAMLKYDFRTIREMTECTK